MIVFDNVTHYFSLNKPPILLETSIALPTDRRIALIGLRGSGRSTVIRLANGLLMPRMGTVHRPPGVSMVVGGSPPSISPKLSMMQYLQDIARTYGAVFDDLVEFVVEWGDAERLLMKPFKKLTSVEKSRIATPMIYGLPFAFYVVDGDPGGRAPKFRDRFTELFRRRIEETGVLFAAPKPEVAARFCDAGVVLHEHTLTYYDSIAEAMAFYETVLAPLETPEDPEEEERLEIADREREVDETPSAVIF